MENNPKITIDLLLRVGFKKLSNDVYIIKGLKYVTNQKIPKGFSGYGSYFVHKGEPIHRIYNWNDLHKFYFEKIGVILCLPK